jgi:hypothetical protein
VASNSSAGSSNRIGSSSSSSSSNGNSISNSSSSSVSTSLNGNSSYLNSSFQQQRQQQRLQRRRRLAGGGLLQKNSGGLGDGAASFTSAVFWGPAFDLTLDPNAGGDAAGSIFLYDAGAVGASELEGEVIYVDWVDHLSEERRLRIEAEEAKYRAAGEGGPEMPTIPVWVVILVLLGGPFSLYVYATLRDWRETIMLQRRAHLKPRIHGDSSGGKGTGHEHDNLSFETHRKMASRGDHLVESSNFVVQSYQNRGCKMSVIEDYPYVQTEHLYNIQRSEIFTLRNEKLHTET